MRSLRAVVLAATLVLGAGASATASTQPDDAAPTDPTPTVVDTAQLRWGMSNEANNRAFAAGTFNHFSAGRVGDPGSGSNTLAAAGATWSNGRPAGWSASSGQVTIQKFDGSTYRPATWSGLSTDSAGTPLGSPLAGTFSNHQIVFDGGSGTVDAAAGDATITWRGDATVLFYSGMSFFYVSDPQLKVVDGVGTVTATLSGFGSSQSDPGAWRPLPDTVVTLADLGPVDLSLERGFSVTPRYLGVKVSGVAQATGGAHFGSFPQSFVDFQETAGSAAFWYSSGGSADEFKKTLPLTVSYDASQAVVPPAPAPADGRRPDTVRNDVKKPPTRRPAPTSAPTTAPAPATPATVSAPSAVTPPIAPVVPTSPAFVQVAQPVTVTAQAPAAASIERSSTAYWWLGAIFLVLAGSVVASTFAYSAIAQRRASHLHPQTAQP
jgi:hypothetical protein